MPLKKNLSAGFSPPLSIAQEVSRYLEDKIIQNELKPGTRLVERSLSETLGVSRISIREAFRILELGGLVRIIPRKGAKVTSITRREIVEIYTLRANLVGLAAKLAALNIKKDDLAALTKLGKQMDEKSKKNDLKSYFQRNLKFHRLLSQAGGNQRLHQILENFGKETHLFRYISLSLPGRMQKSNAYHQNLIQAISKGDGEKAEKIARTILEEAGQALIEQSFKSPAEFPEFGKHVIPDESAGKKSLP
jgi:DNA-binding GntR family transcriptional regulator